MKLKAMKPQMDTDKDRYCKQVNQIGELSLAWIAFIHLRESASICGSCYGVVYE